MRTPAPLAGLARGLCVALLVIVAAAATAQEDATDPLEPIVLLDADAEAFARALPVPDTFRANVVVVLREPGGLVRLVLIDLEHRRKSWALIAVEDLERILDRLGESV